MSPADTPTESPVFLPVESRFDLAGSELSGPRAPVRAQDRSSGLMVGILRPSREYSTRPEALDRLLELDHPNVALILEILRDDRGVYFVIDGSAVETLENSLLSGFSDPARRFALARDVSRGMQYLHKRGLATADLDASHVLATERGTFRVAGFGILEEHGEDTTVEPNPAAEATGDRRRLDLVRFAELLEGAGEALPEPLREIAARCRPDHLDPIIDASELVRVISMLPQVKALPEILEPRPRRPAADLGPTVTVGSGASGPSRSSGASGATGSTTEFPFRPLAELYRVEGRPLDGGMAAVWMAREIATGRKVAVKRLHRKEGIDAGSLERFRREARSIASLSHPHILQLLQPARDDEGDYLVLEWADGGSLRDRLKDHGPLAAEELVDITRKIGSALAYAHRKGVIHRDIKPHNILLTETGEPKLADFGLARSIGDVTMSTSRIGAGSPLYMPPEQHDATHKADARSDLYSLGKTLYQLATDKSPAAPVAEMLPAVLRAPVLHCMEADPARRPATVEEFLAELERAAEKRGAAAWAVPVSLLATAAVALVIWLGRGDGSRQDEPPLRSAEPLAARPIPQVRLAGYFAGNGTAQLAAGQETDADEVEIRLRFDPPPAGDPPEIVVRRGDQSLASERFTSTWSEDGLLVVKVPLDERTNDIAVEVPDRAFRSDVLRIVRMEPEPILVGIDGAERVEPDRYVTAQEIVALDVEFTRAAGLDVLWLACNDERREVRLDGGKARASVRLVPGENRVRWCWPDEDSPLAAGALFIVADHDAPVVAVTRPAEGFVTNQDALDIRGAVTDALPGREATWRLLAGAGDEVVAHGAAPLEGNATFSDQAALAPEVVGSLVLEVVTKDRAGNLAESVRVGLTVDRGPPGLSASPRFVPGFDGRRQLATVTVNARADEPLRAADVNGRPATLTSATEFEVADLPALSGNAYEFVLTDRAGNRSAPFRHAHGIDTTPPEARFSFVESGGALALVVEPLEPLASLAVDGRAVTGASLSGASIPVAVEGCLADRTRWKPSSRTAAGPTHTPFRVLLADPAGNESRVELVVCPDDRRSAVRCRLGASGAIAGTEPCPSCRGQYCPRTGPGGAHPSTASGGPADFWLTESTRVCGYCRWTKD